MWAGLVSLAVSLLYRSMSESSADRQLSSLDMTDSANPLAELIALVDEYRVSPAGRLGQTLDSLQRSYNVFAGNRQDLETWLERFETDTDFALGLMQDGGRIGEFLRWLDRPLHNYIASVRTLVDHSRRIAPKTLGTDTPQLEQYEQRVKDDFDAPLPQFVYRLRNYVLHYELPATGGHFSFDGAEGETHRIFFNADDLLDWNGWTQPAREFIQHAGEQIELHETMRSTLVWSSGFTSGLDI